jgi:hypothetical protein
MNTVYFSFAKITIWKQQQSAKPVEHRDSEEMAEGQYANLL